MKTQTTTHKNITIGKIDLGISLRILLFTLILLCIAVYSAFATRYYSRASSNWGTNTTWSLVTCGGVTAAPGIPGSGDTVYICNTYTVTANVATTIAALFVNSGGTLTITNQNFTVSGATTISGTMNDNNATGANSFGDIIINSGGSFTNTGNAPFSISGSFQNSGSFNPGTGVFTYTGTSKTLSGSISIPSLTINGTCTNNGTLTVSTALSGSGTLTQGTNATLNLGGTYTISSIIFSASGNTIGYTSSGAGQTVISGTYQNLTINKSGQIATLGGATTVSGNLTITAGTLTDGGYQITGNGTGTFSMASGTTLNLGSAGTATLFPTNFTNGNISLDPASNTYFNSNQASTISHIPAYGNLWFNGGSAVTNTYDGNTTIKGNLSVGSNNTMVATGYTITVNGNVDVKKTISSGKILLSGGSAQHSISSTTNSSFGDLELNDAYGASWTGGATTTINGDLTITYGTMSLGIIVTGAVVTGTTSISGTLEFTSNQGGKTFNDVTINSGGTWVSDIAETYTINGNIINNGILTSNTGLYTLAGSGKTLSGTNAVTIANAAITGSYTNNGTFTVSTALSGAGSITQGTNATLNLGGTFTTTTATATAVPNTVVYTGAAGNQTVRAITYHHLTIDNAGDLATMSASITANGNVSVNSGTLIFDKAAAYTFTVAGNISVSSGALFECQQVGGNKYHSILLTGSFTNNGNVKFFFDHDDFVSMTFQGSGKSVVSGSGTWTSLTYMNMNKSTINDTVQILSPGFGTALTTGADLIDHPYPYHKDPPAIFTSGTFIYNIPDNLSNLIDPNIAGDPYFTIPATVRIQIDQGTVDMATYNTVSTTSDLWLKGQLIINGGTVTVSKNTNTTTLAGFYYSNASPTPVFTMNGGTLNCYGAFTTMMSSSDCIIFTMTGGMLTANMGTSATAYELFFLSNQAGTTVNWTGGTVVIQNKSSYTSSYNNADFDIGGSVTGSFNVSGTATAQFGNASTPTTQTMRFIGYPGVTYPHMVITNPGGGKIITLVPYNNSDFKFKSLTINTNQVFDNQDVASSTGTHMMSIMSDNGSYSFYNDGTLTPRTGTVKFAGSSQQTIGGATATPFYNLDFENSCILKVNASSTNTLTTNATVNLNSKTLTLGTTAASPGTLVYTSGMLLKGTFTRWFPTTAIPNGSVNGLFPMGDTISNYRPFYVSYPAGVTTGGSVSINHTTIYGAIAVSLVDGANTVLQRHNSYWTSAYSGFTGVSGTPFNLQAGASGMGTVTNINDLRLMLSNSVIGTAGTNSGTNAAPIAQRTGLTLAQLLNNFYIGTTNTGTSPLPIELVSFNAQPENNMVKLTWTTASEFNNEYFTVERSKDADHFEALLRVKGAGNSNRLTNYTASDTSPLSGVSYYRLKQTDFGGNSKYSAMIAVNFAPALGFHVFPNPSDGSLLYIQFETQVKDEEINVQIFDMNGNIVDQSHMFVSGCLENNIMELELGSKLKQGVYIVKAVSGESVNKCRLVIR